MKTEEVIKRIKEKTENQTILNLVKKLNKEIKKTKGYASEYCGCGDWYDDFCEDAKKDLKKLESSMQYILHKLEADPYANRNSLRLNIADNPNIPTSTRWQMDDVMERARFHPPDHHEEMVIALMKAHVKIKKPY